MQKFSCTIWDLQSWKRKLECRLLEDAATKKKEAENQDKLAEIERDIGVLQNGIKMAEKKIKEWNGEVQSRLLKTVLNCNKLTESNMKVATGVKRKEELSLEIQQLQKKRAKLVKNSWTVLSDNSVFQRCLWK